MSVSTARLGRREAEAIAGLVVAHFLIRLSEDPDALNSHLCRLTDDDRHAVKFEAQKLVDSLVGDACSVFTGLCAERRTPYGFGLADLTGDDVHGFVETIGYKGEQ